MQKITDFFKKVGSVMYDLFIDENRWFQVMVGGMIMVAMMAAVVIWTPYEPNPLQCCFVATVAALISNIFAEYKSGSQKNKFNWKNVCAGMVVPVFIDIVSCVAMIFV